MNFLKIFHFCRRPSFLCYYDFPALLLPRTLLVPNNIKDFENPGGFDNPGDQLLSNLDHFFYIIIMVFHNFFQNEIYL